MVASNLSVNLPSSLAFGIGSRPQEQSDMTVGDTHTFEDEIFNEGAHEQFDD